MDRNLAESLAAKLRIAVEQVVREEYELSILKSIFESDIGASLIFKGGTALRLAFGSPRFADDLDFSSRSSIRPASFEATARSALKSLPDAALIEALAKRFTLFALFRFDVPYISRPFSIKVEVSTGEEGRNRAGDFEIRLLTSEVSNLSVLARVTTLERALEEKKAAWATRRQPRDLFDLWFISQKLGLPFRTEPAGFDSRIIRRELRKYLPRTHWSIVDQWIE